MKKLFLLSLAFYSLSISAQQGDLVVDSLQKPIINLGEDGLLKNINASFDMRLDFISHQENGRDDNYTEFRNLFAIGFEGNISKKVSFKFRNRFNKEATLQTLDNLDGSVELAMINIEATPKTNLQFGKMFAYFGGYEYEFNPTEVLVYNDVQNNLLNYVTGVGVTQKVSENHQFGFQALNSRTMRYSDLYEGKVAENVQEPKWPLALVLNWQGSFFDGKFQTIYSYSRFRIAKGHATTQAITLGNKFHHNNLTLMYDFNYSGEQLDTKGINTEILGGEFIAQDATYLEHWVRAQYQITPNWEVLLTLMTSSAYAKDAIDENSGLDHLKTSYGVIPTLYYKPFSDLNLKFFVAYIGRSYQYSDYSKYVKGITNYDTHELRLGLIAPLRLF